MLVTGATGVVGTPLCDRLYELGIEYSSLGRSIEPGEGRIKADLRHDSDMSIPGKFTHLLHAAPIWLLPDNLEKFSMVGVDRIIVFGSTSVVTKVSCTSKIERELAATLGEAETRLWSLTKALGIELTVFRPTMIYGFGRDKNISEIAKLIRRLGFFPVAGRGEGLRQPVHALDLVDATLSCLDKDPAFGKTYDLGGGERLSYTKMVERVFQGLGRKPRIVHFPVFLYRVMVTIATSAGIVRGVSAAAANRMNENLCFDITPAEVDFGYRPARFLEYPARDLP